MSAVDLHSSIRAVTVYRHGAIVTRQAKIEPGLAEGAVLRLLGLPLSLHDSSLRSKMLSAPGCTLLASGVQVVLDAPTTHAGVSSERSRELKDLRKKVHRLEEQGAFLKKELGLRMAVSERPKGIDGQAPIASPLKARLALIEFANERLRVLQAEQSAVQQELLKAVQRLGELEDERERESSEEEAQEHELRKAALITTQGTLAPGVDALLELQYFVPGAAWAPSYAVRLGAELQRGMLSMRALVSQRSGEDWLGVDLTLSTADALGWAELPELRSRRIGRRQAPEVKRGWRARPHGLDDLYADYDEVFAGTASPGFEPPTPPVAMAKEMAHSMMAGALRSDFDDEITGVMSDSLDDYASNAAPAPQAAPAMMMSSMAVEAEEVTMVTRVREPSRPSAKKQKSRRAAVSGAYPGPAAGGLSFGGRSEPEPEPTPSGYDNPLLNYARLRMPSAHSSERGTLQEASTRAIYAESFSEPALAQRVFDIYAQRLEQASDLSALPTGHTRPFSEDYDYAFRAESRLDVSSDGRFHSLPIVQRESEGRALHIVVPRESTDVFRTIKLRNPFDGPLLGGPIDVYWAGDFLLTSNVEFTAPKGELDIGLGVDQAVKVSRNTHYREDTVGLMGGSLELTHKVVVEVSNGGGHAIDLHVRERVPVPASHEEEDIRVEIKNVAPAWQPYSPLAEDAGESALRGGHVWALHLDPGELSELSVSYEIKMSSKFELRGGNRREW